MHLGMNITYEGLLSQSISQSISQSLFHQVLKLVNDSLFKKMVNGEIIFHLYYYKWKS